MTQLKHPLKIFNQMQLNVGWSHVITIIGTVYKLYIECLLSMQRWQKIQETNNSSNLTKTNDWCWKT